MGIRPSSSAELSSVDYYLVYIFSDANG